MPVLAEEDKSIDTLAELKKRLHQFKKPVATMPIFYKTSPGDYAEHDQFIGVSVPALRQIARQYKTLPLSAVQLLLESPINEERLLALLILVNRYQKENAQTKQEIYQFYLKNLQHINNWNLVDASAHLIVGAHLLNADKTKLITLTKSPILWERRIAIVATWYFIRHHQLKPTIQIAELLLQDQHDLIQKAVGWMLREAGKRDQQVLINFLEKYAPLMPRTMLRYAIEKFSADERKAYLAIPRITELATETCHPGQLPFQD